MPVEFDQGRIIYDRGMYIRRAVDGIYAIFAPYKMSKWVAVHGCKLTFLVFP